MKTTTQKIAEYLGCFEAGERVKVVCFIEAYGHDEAKAALFELRRDDALRLIAESDPFRFCQETGLGHDEAFIQGAGEKFSTVEVV